jgi:hypothetical protein
MNKKPQQYTSQARTFIKMAPLHPYTDTAVIVDLPDKKMCLQVSYGGLVTSFTASLHEASREARQVNK